MMYPVSGRGPRVRVSQREGRRRTARRRRVYWGLPVSYSLYLLGIVRVISTILHSAKARLLTVFHDGW